MLREVKSNGWKSTWNSQEERPISVREGRRAEMRGGVAVARIWNAECRLECDLQSQALNSVGQLTRWLCAGRIDSKPGIPINPVLSRFVGGL